jgi:hypothetical protein
MKKVLLLMPLIFNLWVYSDDHKAKRISSAFENGNTITDIKPELISYGHSVVIDSSRKVPGLTTWWDYWTNGNNQRMLSVLGDTVIVSVAYIDSSNAAVSAGRVLYYQVSFNGGVTWENDPLLIDPLPRGGAYPDVMPVIISGSRTIVITGRQFDNGSRGFSGVEVILGAGSFANTLVPPPGSDYFSCLLSSTEIGGVYQAPDTMWFRKFNYTNISYGPRTLIATPPNEVAVANARKYIASSSSGQNVFIMWYDAVTGSEKIVGKRSSDAGATWGTLTTVLPFQYVSNGDQTSAWFGADVIYKPNTNNVCAAFNTNTVSSIKGYKVLFWSPTINGGNPVRIADWTNTPSLADTAWAFNSTATIQVGMLYVSHPSLAYSSDGSRLYCVFSVCQKDSVVYPNAGGTYLFNDLYSSYSGDDGATWSAPVKLGFCTTDGDEIYPVLSKTGNSPGNFGLLYMLSGFPGSSSFTNTATPRSRNYTVYTRVDPVSGNQLSIGITPISTTVPKEYALYQNYPNPFNPTTTIRFDIAKTDVVKIRVYDIVGREVSYFNQQLAPGKYEHKFSAANLASGVYFYRLETGHFSDVKKMILIK